MLNFQGTVCSGHLDSPTRATQGWVKKLIALAEAPKYQRTDYKSKLDDYKELII